jgi:hypothetical protein
MAPRLHVADVQPRPEVTACRTVYVRRDPVVDSVHLAPHLVVALAADHVLAAATVHPRKLTAVLLSLVRPGRAREIARLV